MKKRLSALFLALVLGLSISVPALAFEDSVSEPTYIDDYTIWSELWRDNGRYCASTWIRADRGNVPGDTIVQSFLFNGNKEVKKTSESIFGAAYPMHQVATPYVYVASSGNVTARGLVKMWDEDSGRYIPYETKWAYESEMSRMATIEKPTELPVNINGKTYGSLLLADQPNEYPDLISAVGTEGQSGYVRNEDLLFADADLVPDHYASRKIRLYDVNENVIGVFAIDYFPDNSGKDIETIKSEMANHNAELYDLADQVLVDGKYPVNINGESYGPLILRDLVGYTPDLSPAINQDGLSGYVRNQKELPVNTKEMDNRSGVTTEPLYDKNGNIVGTYELAEPISVTASGGSISRIINIRDNLQAELQSK